MRVLGRNGMVASPHYLATGAGVRVLRGGGNAIDAAIATNAVLGVVTPYLCGLGGDLFAQVYRAEDRSLTGLNGSGRAPAHATRERVAELTGGKRIPARGPLPVTVPGCVEAWGALHERLGMMPFAELLTDAQRYASEGFPVTAAFSRSIAASAIVLHPDTPASETFLPDGRAPLEGEIFRQPRLAETLRTIAQDGPGAYYRGSIANEIARSVQAVGGLITVEDLAEHRSDWVEPVRIAFRDVTVFELPPNSQGIIALQMLGMLQELPREPIVAGGAEYVHVLAEVARLAYADRVGHVTDLQHMIKDPAELLEPAYIRDRAGSVGKRAAAHPVQSSPGDTIYLCTADNEGNLVSLIESNFMGIGSGVMAGETGVMLQNRGHWFSLEPSSVNVIAPRKRTMHTLMPGMAFRHNRPWLVFGTMGGSAQPQIHVEILTRILDQGMAIDAAIDAPRFDAVMGAGPSGAPMLVMENRFPEEVQQELRSLGHDVRMLEPFTSAMGHAHAIEVLESGVYAGAADPRADSLAMGY
ncbi:MAG: gamma-glutamyltransferase [Chloroflexota bacterium]